MFNGSMYNADLFNGSGFTERDERTFSPDQPFILHLTDSAGVFLRKIEGIIDGSWDDKINAPGTLKFSVPLDGFLAQTGDLVNPNRILLYDSTLEILKQFVIVNTTSKGFDNVIDVECYGTFYLLSLEFSPLSGELGGATTLELQIQDILQFQVNATPITLGYIHPRYAKLASVVGISTDKSIFSALMFMWKQHGGAMSIDPFGRFRWDSDSVKTAQYVLSLGEDIVDYEYKVDTKSIVNRIYGKGNIHDSGATHNRIIVGGGGGFIQDTDSQAIYGIRPKRITFNTEDEIELALLSARTLNYLKDPRIVRNIGVIDLARIQFDPDNPIIPHPEYIKVGGKLKINPPGNIPGDGTFSAMILTVKRDLKEFLKVEITVGDTNAISTRGRATAGTDSEFFDLLADQFTESEEYDEISFEQTELIWAAIDNFGDFAEVPSTSDGEIEAIGSENDAGGTATAPAFVDHVHQGVILVPFNGDDTAVSDLGTPAGMAFGYLDDSAGTDEGLWFFPPNGTVNGDWIPMPSYN